MFFAMHIMHIFILLINILLRLSQQKNWYAPRQEDNKK